MFQPVKRRDRSQIQLVWLTVGASVVTNIITMHDWRSSNRGIRWRPLKTWSVPIYSLVKAHLFVWKSKKRWRSNTKPHQSNACVRNMSLLLPEAMVECHCKLQRSRSPCPLGHWRRCPALVQAQVQVPGRAREKRRLWQLKVVANAEATTQSTPCTGGLFAGG